MIGKTISHYPDFYGNPAVAGQAIPTDRDKSSRAYLLQKILEWLAKPSRPWWDLVKKFKKLNVIVFVMLLHFHTASLCQTLSWKYGRVIENIKWRWQ